MRRVSDVQDRFGGAFTLIELLAVLVILGLLAGLIGPQIIKLLNGAKSDSARSQIEDLSGALDLYRFEIGRYPTSAEGLSGLVQAPPGVTGWNGPYLEKPAVPDDPWGNAYRYRSPGEFGPYDLYSLGQDNADGGDGENQDVLGWE